VDDAVIAEIVEEMGDSDESHIVLELHEAHQQVEEYAGPIPDPATLAQYESVLPGLADRLIKLEEDKTTLHLRTIAKLADADIDNTRKLVDAEVLTAKRGQIQAYSLALIAFAASITFFALGIPVAGGILLGFPVIVLISAFLNRRVVQPAEATKLAKKFAELDDKNDVPTLDGARDGDQDDS
jgi:uncharacterized membrane protein